MSERQPRLIDYLSAKKAVDDKALNQGVWETAWRAVGSEQPRVIELGCGIGTMIERVLQSGMLKTAEYTAVDIDPTLLEEAERRLVLWAARENVRAEELNDRLRLSTDSLNLDILFRQGDVADLAPSALGAGYDLVVASALLDLVHLERVVPLILDLLRSGGVFYFAINFDGVTSFLPYGDLQLEQKVEAFYHRSMDERKVGGEPSGGSRTGRLLLSMMLASGHEVLAFGASDWVVAPRNGDYVHDDRAFLAEMLRTVESALRGAADLGSGELEAWLTQKRALLSQNQLIYLTHQLDLCGRKR